MRQKESGKIKGIFGRLVRVLIDVIVFLRVQDVLFCLIQQLPTKKLNFFQGDLGAIDDKYDVAISTACGPLDNIVCDSIDTAQKCITFLKQNDIGTATFIGLDKVWKSIIIIVNCFNYNVCIVVRDKVSVLGVQKTFQGCALAPCA